MDRFVYADNAATTKPSQKVINTLTKVLEEDYGNPSSLYEIGSSAKNIIDEARKKVAFALNAEEKEIYFTSGGSEADNWAIKGAALRALKKGKNEIISTVFEHHAVLNTLKALEKQGFKIILLPVYENGIIHLEDLKAAFTDKTALVSIMYAKNEIGTIQPVKEIGAICKEKGVLFHTDAVQAVGNIEIDVKEQNIDMLSLSAHKFHGPKGVGALYINKSVFIENLIDGGAQERHRRAGTENTASIAAFGTAIEEACSNIKEKQKKIKEIRDRVINGALKIERSRLNGDIENRLCGNVNVCFEGIEGESLILMLDMKGICASSGSACTSGSLDPSHVLLSIGLPHEIAHGSLRLSFSDNNTIEDADYILEVLPPIVKRLREMSPLWDRIKRGE